MPSKRLFLLMIGQTLGHYRIVEKIGAGGMGEVYRAHDEQLERDVALKVLPPGTIADETARKLFRKEALALAKLNHPNIETVFEFSTQDGNDFLAMELIPGSSLRERLKEGPLTEEEVFRLAAQFAEGLVAAHEHGVVHRDLKPGNLFVTPDGRLKILDFGLARLLHQAVPDDVTQSLTDEIDSAAGTLPYMAPEQLRGEAVDARSDIYGAGAVLYEMATGRRAFPDTQPARLISSILHDMPPSPTSLNGRITPALEAVILRAIEKQAAERYQSAREFAAALETARAGKIVPRARRALVLAAAGVSLLLIASVLTALNLGDLRGRFRKRTVIESPIKARRSLAVLGFQNLSGRADEAWLSTALSEMLTTELDAGGELRTIPGENVEQMKINLALRDGESYGKGTLNRIRKTLGTDDVVSGSYLALGNGQVRLDVRLQDAAAGETLASDVESGSETDVSALIARVGSRLRENLGVAGVSSADAGAVLASLPQNSEAMRLYSGGLAKLRHFDALGARDLLQKAVTADPEFALSHAALAAAWSALGYDVRAKEEAKKAFDLSERLQREDRLSVEGRYHETVREWDKAIEVYRTLFGFFPDNLEYGLRLSSVQTSSGKAKDALATVDAIRKLPFPAGDDPRVDLAEATAATSLADFKRTDAAAERAATKAAAQEARLLFARARLVQGNAFRNLGDSKKAAHAYDEAKSVFAATGDQGAVAVALNSIAILSYERGDLDEAKRMYEESLRISRSIGYQVGVARAQNNIAMVLLLQGDSTGAENSYGRALANFRDLGDKRAAALALNNIAHLRRNDGNFTGAGNALEEALSLFRETGDKSGVARVLNNMGIVFADQGKLVQAKGSYEQALAVCGEIANKTLSAYAFSGEGDVLLAEGDLDGAREQQEKALALRKELGEEGTATESRLALALLSIEQGRPADAEGPARDAAEDFRKRKEVNSEALSQAILSRSLLAQSKLPEAQASVDRADALLRGNPDRDARLFVAIIAARVRAASGDSADAKKRLAAALAEATKTGFVAHQLEARLALGEIEIKSGETAAGRSRLAILEKEAAQRGYQLIARKAAAASQ